MKVAVIGTGSMGRNHSRVLSEMGVLGAVCDTDLQRARQVSSHYNCPWYIDYREMIAREELQAVVVAAPTSYHRDIALECLNKGLNVLVEKPVGRNVEEAREIIGAKKKDKILMVGHVERFNPVVHLAKEHINSDAISASFKRLGLMPQTRDVDVILDLSIHDLDIARYLFGRLELISAVGIEKEGLLEYVSAKLRAGETLVDIESSRLSPVKIRSFYALDHEKMLEANYITQSMEIYRGVKPRGYPASFGEFLLRGLQAKKETLSLIPEEPLKIELEHFVGCVEKNRSPLITGEDVLSTMKLSEEIRERVIL